MTSGAWLFSLVVLVCACSVRAGEVTVSNVRVQALSPILIRIESQGPRGFEDRPTFTAVDRNFSGIPIKVVNGSDTEAWLQSDYYFVHLKFADASSTRFQSHTDVADPVRSASYPDGTQASTRDDCASMCQKDSTCRAWVFVGQDSNDVNCWPLSDYSQRVVSTDREFGCIDESCLSRVVSAAVLAANGTVLWQQDGQPPVGSELLHWPSPVTDAAYALTDYPRFFAPAWGPTPVPAGVVVDPALVDTNGYDFRNNQYGDQYIFLLGDSLESWQAARAECIKLIGPTPLLPDFAYGTWFTWWHSYTEEEAKADVQRWKSDDLPIDVWGLDMNWRNTTDEQDRFYDHPNTTLFPNFTEWFDYLAENNLRTYFNDHPFPVDNQTTPKEVAFRWDGLTSWLAKGLTFWWFDRNWGFSIPPPNRPPVDGWNVSHTGGNWNGMDNAAWGSHLYFSTVERYNKDSRPADFPRTITLTKFDQPDWKAGMSPMLHAESPAQHRYPVWWTGDGVTLQASVESMVDSGVHDLKPFVHSDCGGDYRPDTGGDLLRWTAHCVFGTILRFHGSDHRPWGYTTEVEVVIRLYLKLRYSLIPSLIAAGQTATVSAFPLVARLDLFYPEHPEARSNQQYLFLNDTLVAPIFDSSENVTSRQVWVPPGDWQDVWDGSVVTGPQTITTSQPYEKQPMWHRRGGMFVSVDSAALRVDDLDWSTLVLQVFPHLSSPTPTTTRLVASKNDDTPTTSVHMDTVALPSRRFTRIAIEPTRAHSSPNWLLRIHLRPNERVSAVYVDGVERTSSVTVLNPLPFAAGYFPFGGRGSRPAMHAGDIVEVDVDRSPRARSIVVEFL